MEIYPLKFHPIIKDKIWGGQKLHDILGKDLGTLPNGGESWELSGVAGNVSVIANGEYANMPLTEAIDKFKGELVGQKVYDRFGTNFPLLIKFIDANDNLSVQVHPNDEMARQRHNSFGKTEMWYVLAADEGATLIAGFAKHIAAADYKPLLESGRFMETLAAHKVKRGDVIFMPAGRIHAIGKGVMVAEIQQTSDITYRVYDYDRRDANGNQRELHVDEAQAAINFDDADTGLIKYQTVPNGSTEVVSCKYFTTNVLTIDGALHRDYAQTDSFVILMCVGGGVTVDGTELRCGETVLLPAYCKGVDIRTIGEKSELLEVYIKD